MVKLWNGEYHIDRNTYRGGMHGFARNCEFQHAAAEDLLEFILSSDEKTMKLFPRRFMLTVNFSL